jgi:hypothetical protein
MSPERLVRKLLEDDTYLCERVVTLTSDGKTNMMSLYCLYTMWYDIGGGKKDYDTPVDVITPHKREVLVERSFAEFLAAMADLLVKTTLDAVADELENLEDEHLIPQRVVLRWVKENIPDLYPHIAAVDTDGPTVLLPSMHIIGYQNAIRLFNAPFWEEYAELYGGKKWAQITEALMHLHDSVKRAKGMKDIMFAIDRLYDMEHNTGSLVGKLPKNVAVSEQDLDLRASIRSVREFYPYVSSQVKKIIDACPRYKV